MFRPVDRALNDGVTMSSNTRAGKYVKWRVYAAMAALLLVVVAGSCWWGQNRRNNEVQLLMRREAQFELAASYSGACRVSARAPFHAPTPQVLVGGVGADQDPWTIDVRILFLARGGALEGVLLDGEGNPVVNAQVLVGEEVDFTQKGDLDPIRLAEELLSDAFVEDRVEKKLDAALLDIAPNRFTVLRRRWDPFFTTHHQIGLRPGGLLVNELGLALFGKAALSRAPEALTDVGIVIRRAEPDPDQAPTELVFRVADAEAFAAEFTTPAAAADRGSVVQPDPVEPLLFSLPRAEAVERVASKRLVGDVGYEVKRIDVDDNQITHLLVISQSEIAEVRGPLLDAHITAITEQVTADNEATIRQEVIDEFAAQGIIAPQEQIDAAVVARLQALIDAAVQDIEENVLPGELEAALLPLLTFESQPTFFGEMQTEHLLAIKGFDLVHLTATERFYYRDHFDSATEKTLAQRLAWRREGATDALERRARCVCAVTADRSKRSRDRLRPLARSGAGGSSCRRD